MMKILLVRPAHRSILAGTNLIKVEPLDLEYLAAVCREEGVEWVIYDALVERRSLRHFLRKHRPNVVGITGYVTMKNMMLTYAASIKALDPAIKVIIGGAHAELNYADFYSPYVDWIVHSGGAETFRRLIRANFCLRESRLSHALDKVTPAQEQPNLVQERVNPMQEQPNLAQERVNSMQEQSNLAQERVNSMQEQPNLAQESSDSEFPGVCYRNAEGQWICTESATFDPDALPLADRSHFQRYRRHFKYMQYQPCAIVKTSYGCPFSCNFCYCCLLNNGQYTSRQLEKVIDEIEKIDAEYIWIVDDTFLVNRARVSMFVELLRAREISRKFCVYSRADFLVENADLLPLLREVGVSEVIIGLEAVNDEKLLDYNKRSSDELNRNAVRFLRDAGINCIGLFMLDIDAGREDFRDLLRWVKENQLRYFVPSIFTPLPGTELFSEYRDRLITHNYEKWDLLHLVLKPTRLSKWRFYYEFYKIYGAMIWANVRTEDFTFKLFFRKMSRGKEGGRDV